MAFYFALLNVSSKRDEKANANQRNSRRRRHSIASVESPILDYRLLPRPQVVRNAFYRDDDIESTHLATSSHQDGPSSSRHINNDHPTTSTSDTQQQPSRRQYRPKDATMANGATTRENGHMREMRRSESNYATTNNIQQRGKKKQKAEARQKVRDEEEEKERRRKVMEREEQRRAECRQAEHDGIRDGYAGLGPREAVDKTPQPRPGRSLRGKGGRPLVVRRRISPPDSTTSGSRRSSKGSNNSIAARRESPASSSSSRRASAAPADLTNSPTASLLQASLKLSGISLSPSVPSPTKLCEPRASILKKVTFDNDTHYIIGNSFLGDRGVLVRRGSGTTLRAPSMLASNSNRQLVHLLDKVPLERGEDYGAEWWTPFLAGEGTEKHQNETNTAIERASRPSGLRSCLLRRRSTSDCSRVVFAFRNQGYLNPSEEVLLTGQEMNKMTVSVDRPDYSSSRRAGTKG